MKKQKISLDSNSLPKAIVLFLLSYALLFVLGRFFYNWDSPMYFLPPIAGFFLMFFLVDWIEEFFETRILRKWYFPFFVFALAAIAEYVALFWNYNFYAFAARGSPMEITSIFFVDSFKASAFLPFTLSCILGWLSRLIIEQTKKSK